MNIQQEIEKILEGVINKGKGQDFTLTKDSCDVFVKNNSYQPRDRQRLGRAMSNMARNPKTTVIINGVKYVVEFNNIYNKCANCGYRGNANVAHYKITKL